MKKVELKYVGPFQNKGIYEINEDEVNGLIKSGIWESVDNQVWKAGKVKPTPYPTERWTEKKIAAWLVEHKIPISYSVDQETKKDKLKEIAEYYS